MAQGGYGGMPHYGGGGRGGGGRGGGRGGGSRDGQTRKIFIGGLNYNTTEDTLKEHFSQYGELVDVVVMKFPDTKRSRGFGFVTYSKEDEVDACQSARPHTIDGKTVETKRATPREEFGHKPEAGATIKKLFLGGLKEDVEDDEIRSYFSQFGTVAEVTRLTDKDTGKKKGFGFVEFDDYDPVDKVLLQGNHQLGGRKVDVKKAVSKQEMNVMGGGGGRGGGRGGGFGGGRGGGGGFGGGGGGWGQQQQNSWSGGGGGNGGWGDGGGGYGGQQSGGGYGGQQGGWGGGGQQQGGWGGGQQQSAGGGGGWGGNNSGGQGGWGQNGGGFGGNSNGYSSGGGGFGGGGGGPMRSGGVGGGNRSMPYGNNRGGRGGGGGGYGRN